MGSLSRKGLKRNGWRGYVLEGLRGKIFIDRDGPTLWFVRRDGMPRVPGGFFVLGTFNRLRSARRFAEEDVGALPQFLDRRGEKCDA